MNLDTFGQARTGFGHPICPEQSTGILLIYIKIYNKDKVDRERALEKKIFIGRLSKIVFPTLSFFFHVQDVQISFFLMKTFIDRLSIGTRTCPKDVLEYC